MKKWKCNACSYVFSVGEQPDKCPACGAGQDRLVEVAAEGGEQPESQNSSKGQGTAAEEKPLQVSASERKWRCTICNYVHTGEEPPDECPVCGADKSYFVEVTEEELEKEKSSAGREQVQKAEESKVEEEGEPEPATEEKPPFGLLGYLVDRFHLHPITVHVPNGVLPVAVLFLALAMFFHYGPLEQAAFYNLAFVLISLPAVLFTGYIAWQRKFNGAMTRIFKGKLTCSAIIAVLVTILVFWRIIDPGVALAGGTGSWVYLGIELATLFTAAVAGTLGGKLVFGK